MSTAPGRRLEITRSVSMTVAPFLSEQDTPFGWLYKPHTVTGLLFAASLVAYFAFVEDPAASDDLGHSRRAFACAAAVFLVYCVIQLRDSLLLRPHPILWRLVHGLGLLYLLGLVVLLVSTVDAARAYLRFLSPSLTGARPAANDAVYAADCRVYTPEDPAGPFARVVETVWDIFVPAHFFGWCAKALLLRDWRLGWTLSVVWELLELTFQRMLPNFYECWWDHWLIDFLFSNGAGLWIGMQLVSYLQMRRFDWTGRQHDTPSTPLGQMQRLGRQLLPLEFTSYQWRILDKPKHLLAAATIIIVMEVVELNAFFLKYVLYVPPPNPLNALRLLLWFLISIPAAREYYQYFSDENTKRMGPNMWLAFACMIVETLISIKFSAVTPFPDNSAILPEVRNAWLVAGAAFTAWCCLRFTSETRRPAVLMNSLIAVVAGAFAYIAISQDAGLGTQPLPGSQ